MSVAVTRALKYVKHMVALYMFCLYQTKHLKEKWDLVLPDGKSITHKVRIDEVIEDKIKALKMHVSQSIRLINELEEGKCEEEYFQLVRVLENGESLLQSVGIFEEVI